jgi:hypothetical protein
MHTNISPITLSIKDKAHVPFCQTILMPAITGIEDKGCNELSNDMLQFFNQFNNI